MSEEATQTALNWSMLVPVMAACIAAFAAVWGAWLTQRAQAENRRLSRELKIAEFRQNWINQLRDDLAEFAGLSTFDRTDEQWHRMAMLLGRINLRMNPGDEDYPDLQRALDRCLNAMFPRETQHVQHGSAESKGAQDELVKVGHRILKREWETLKSDLKELIT